MLLEKSSGDRFFEAVSIDLSGHAAINRFVLELKEVGWELGVAEGSMI